MNRASSPTGTEWGRMGMKSWQTQESWGHGRNCSPQEVSLLHGMAQSWCCCIQVNKESASTVRSWTTETGLANLGEGAMVDTAHQHSYPSHSPARLKQGSLLQQRPCPQHTFRSQQQRGEPRYSIQEKQTINGRCDCVPQSSFWDPFALAYLWNREVTLWSIALWNRAQFT